MKMETITIKSKEPMVVIPMKKYESIIETIEVLNDKELMRQIRESKKYRKRGKKPVDFEKIKKKAGF